MCDFFYTAHVTGFYCFTALRRLLFQCERLTFGKIRDFESNLAILVIEAWNFTPVREQLLDSARWQTGFGREPGRSSGQMRFGAGSLAGTTIVTWLNTLDVNADITGEAVSDATMRRCILQEKSKAACRVRSTSRPV